MIKNLSFLQTTSTGVQVAVAPVTVGSQLLGNDTPMIGDLLVTNTGVPATPASGKTRVYVDAALKQLSFVDDTGLITNLSGGAVGFTGGRLTLASNTPVMNANAVAQSAIYYTPYVHNLISIFNGTTFSALPFVQSSVVADSSNVLAGSLYDLFMCNVSGVPTLGYGPAWASLTARTAAITLLQGMRVNSAPITLRMSSGVTQVVEINQATYVGTFYATANGQTGMNFIPTAAAGGTANILGLFNAQNQVRMIAVNRNSTASWAYSTNPTWRAQAGNTNNSISYVDGLGVVSPASYLTVPAQNSNSGAAQIIVIGINLNSTTATPPTTGAGAAAVSVGTTLMLSAAGLFLPVMGYNTLTAMEAASNSGTTFFGSGLTAPGGQSESLSAQLLI